MDSRIEIIEILLLMDHAGSCALAVLAMKAASRVRMMGGQYRRFAINCLSYCCSVSLDWDGEKPWVSGGI